ncbi:MAG: hypothetical protein HQK83_12830 [Fibrobacteria bacterium]|nr:hypothetical protein [Fibrobacteria bacterium]
MNLKKHLNVLILELIISGLHYSTPIHLHHFHAIFQRLYYFPIILAAYYFNLKFAIAYAVLSGLLYIPHIFFQWEGHAVHSFTQYIEISMFVVIAAVLGFLFDSRRRQQDKILQQQEELSREKRLSLLGKLAAGLAHEIRNPLGGLLGSAEILEDSLGKEHPKAEFVQIIQKELKRVNGKLNEFLDFARPRKPDLVPNDIHDIIREVVFIIKTEADKAGITIKEDYALPMPLIPVDAEQIKQVILNIVLNSLKALPNKGELVIKTIIQDKEIIVSFKDNGPGISPKERDSIFEPFYTTKEKGTGLGLSISQQLTEAHHGTLTALHQEKGACFELRLPHE